MGDDPKSSDTGTGGEGEGGGGAGPAGGGGGQGDVRQVVLDVLDKLLADGTLAVKEGGEPAGPPAAGGGAPASPARIEADMEAQVRAAISKIRTEEDRDNLLSQLKEKVLTPETPPAKQRWVERLVWGSAKAEK